MDMKEILKPSAILICSAVTDRIVGYVLLSYTRQEACMRIAVHPEFQGKGFGSQLLGEAIKLARERRISSILLYVATFRIAAIQLYTKHGFTKDKLLSNYYCSSPSSTTHNGDAYEMRLTLSIE
ncbi:hypothetical protein DI09_5p470 [Mitosporidium daphniae]|uniref:N-acetyltransferase domain-containing protein n=1 Tax=Mitosporidium daphniae TaxID=1485682 RepID=A0A098VP08_9MICR|nr:uncharacterized protein DI09_5p470 [Mitosporidium daphniae]KGG50700.1 hypothetical protein DI09_5p470 [Mitosporidium daphniae]|eukprot:XP_013237127.1 uncharacterized protein DI09_5p470 [Mitosporidium daphniae]